MASLLGDALSIRKSLGSYYTPPKVAETLVRWVVRRRSDRMLDPACGDGRFLASHSNVVGVDRDVAAVAAVAQEVPHAMVVAADFFDWASDTNARFDCVAGNPPFIRYQQFNGEVRKTALKICSQLGATLTGLTSSWAPFVIVAASLLKPNGRLAFVVPAEIGHAPYARPVVQFLLNHFGSVVVAVKNKVFPDLSEDVWFVYASGFGKSSSSIILSAYDTFADVPKAPSGGERIERAELATWNDRLRPFLLPKRVRDFYVQLLGHNDTPRTICATSTQRRRFARRPSGGFGRLTHLPSMRKGPPSLHTVYRKPNCGPRRRRKPRGEDVPASTNAPVSSRGKSRPSVEVSAGA